MQASALSKSAIPAPAQGSEGEAPATTTVSSRFAYEVLTKEDQAAKAPGARRGKDGHVSLPGLDDPFCAPAAGRAPRCGLGFGMQGGLCPFAAEFAVCSESLQILAWVGRHCVCWQQGQQMRLDS